MQYFGGKKKIAKWIAKYINTYYLPGLYIEPFCGMCNVGSLVGAETRIFSDSNEYLICMWERLQAGWIPPDFISYEEYKRVKSLMDSSDPLTAYVGFQCSFSGKFFGGYAISDKITRNYCTEARASALSVLPKVADAHFICCDYSHMLATPDATIYCDPPYKGTTSYKGQKFNSYEFWDRVRDNSYKSIILISEYEAPKDFTALMEIGHRTDTRTNGDNRRVERLFTLRDGLGDRV